MIRVRKKVQGKLQLILFAITILLGIRLSISMVQAEDLLKKGDGWAESFQLSSFIDITFLFSTNLKYVCSNNTEQGGEVFNTTVNLTHNIFPILGYYMNSDFVTKTSMNDIYPVLSARTQDENTAEVFVQDERFDLTKDNLETTVQVPLVEYTMEQLTNYAFLVSHFYTVNSDVVVHAEDFDPEYYVNADLRLKEVVEGPQILLYHTHSQESFVDSKPGDESQTVVGIGDELTRILEEEYGISVYHLRDSYDLIDGVLDRSKAYESIEPDLEKILAENPTIEVMIDLHRDGIPDDMKLVTTIDGKQTAKIMFFNGLSKLKQGEEMVNVNWMTNSYVKDNMAFSFQMHMKANSLYPGFTRKIFIKGPRYNLHLMPRSLLVEVGAQTNTVEEAKNAMAPLAAVLNEVLR